MSLVKTHNDRGTKHQTTTAGAPGLYSLSNNPIINYKTNLGKTIKIIKRTTAGAPGFMFLIKLPYDKLWNELEERPGKVLQNHLNQNLTFKV